MKKKSVKKLKIKKGYQVSLGNTVIDLELFFIGGTKTSKKPLKNQCLVLAIVQHFSFRNYEKRSTKRAEIV